MAQRNAAKTKEKILDAAGRILERDGFQALGINSLAAEADVGKPLIYRYFGGFEGVIEALQVRIRQDERERPASVPENGDIVMELIRYGRRLAGDRLKRDFAVWEIADADIRQRPEKHDNPEALPLSAANDELDKEAAAAILKAAVHFLVLYRDRHDSWEGVPLSTPKHMARLERALVQMAGRIFPGR